ncbi:MAG: hypothetical protein KDC83_13240 [Flavobacteriales bacterium]|nr:hypothetical protein [Flavobacteriales bacterium]
MSERNELNEDQLENVSGGASMGRDSGDDGSRDFEMSKEDEHKDPHAGEQELGHEGGNPHEMDSGRGAAR